MLGHSFSLWTQVHWVSMTTMTSSRNPWTWAPSRQVVVVVAATAVVVAAAAAAVVLLVVDMCLEDCFHLCLISGHYLEL